MARIVDGLIYNPRRSPPICLAFCFRLLERLCWRSFADKRDLLGLALVHTRGTEATPARHRRLWPRLYQHERNNLNHQPTTLAHVYACAINDHVLHRKIPPTPHTADLYNVGVGQRTHDRRLPLVDHPALVALQARPLEDQHPSSIDVLTRKAPARGIFDIRKLSQTK